MNWLDYVLLALVGLSAVHGLRLGAVVQVFSFGGFWLGLFFGALLVPPLLASVHGRAKELFALVLVFGCAAVVGGIGRFVGSHSSRLLHQLRLGPIDAGLGAGVAVVSTLLAAWMLSVIFVWSSATTLNAAIDGSRILRGIDSFMPAPPTVFSRIESFVGSQGFPVVFNGLPPHAAGQVAPPSAASLDAAVRAAQGSTVKIMGTGCGVIQEGSGFVVAPGDVLTNAHVVAGIRQPEVFDQAGIPRIATVVLFDPEMDLALLAVRGLQAPVLHLDPHLVGRGTTGAVLGFPEGGPFDVQPAGVLAPFQASGLDIYGRHQTVREVYELEALVRPGNSGGPLVEPDGTVVGVVFARSTVANDVGYALASPAVLQEVAPMEGSSIAMGTGGCAA